MLRPDDAEALSHLGQRYTTANDGGFVNVIVDDYPAGPALEPSRSALLLRLPLGFPDATPDMFWFDPPLRAAGGAVIPGTEVLETHYGRAWQRWSRHIQGQWRPGIDNLATYLAYVRRCLDVAGGRT